MTMATSNRTGTAVVLLAAGAVLTWGGLMLVVANAVNTPPVFLLMIVIGVVTGFVGLAMIVTSAIGSRRSYYAHHRCGPSMGTQEGDSVSGRGESGHRLVCSTAAVVLITAFLFALGLVAGFFYLLHRWFGDWNLW
jgi:hypothetical protein